MDDKSITDIGDIQKATQDINSVFGVSGTIKQGVIVKNIGIDIIPFISIGFPGRSIISEPVFTDISDDGYTYKSGITIDVGGIGTVFHIGVLGIVATGIVQCVKVCDAVSCGITGKMINSLPAEHGSASIKSKARAISMKWIS